MELELATSLMAKRLVVEPPTFSLYFFFNLFSTLFVWVIALIKLRRNTYILARLSFCLAVLISLLFMLPLVIFSQRLESSLSEPWKYALAVNGAAMLLMSWVYLSRHFDVFASGSFSPPKTSQIHLITGVLSIFLVWAYFFKVPWNCSGIYALLYDPTYTLLARELVGKLAGSSYATYSLGSYAGAVAPVFIFFSIWMVGKYFSSRKFLAVLICILCGFLAIAALLVSGTKGFLMPTTLMLASAFYFYLKTWRSRLLSFAMTALFFYCSLATFQLLKDRETYAVKGRYDFATCAVKINACESSLSLLESMKGQTHPLGLPFSAVGPIQSRLKCLCAEGESKSCSSTVQVEKRTVQVEKSTVQVEKNKMQVEKSTENYAMSKATLSVNLEVLSSQLNSFTKAILYRIFVVPFQVSVWHFMYAESEAVDGVKTLPFARRLTGSSLNMPEIVYQKYGSIYWEGDKTTTSSAPTSFIWAYTAYLGWVGFCIALFSILSLDIFLSAIAKNSGRDILPIFIGTISILSVNFLASDFVTTLVSHGGIAGILILLIYAALIKLRPGSRA